MKKVVDFLTKHQKQLLGMAIFLSLIAVSITFVDGKIKLNLRNYPVLMILLVVLSIVLVLIYIRIDIYKMKSLSIQIKSEIIEKSNEFETLILELTSRQKEVYEKIMSGKTNKEIMGELFIEQSTLKTHINHIYKKLNIKNRKELKSRIIDGKSMIF
jgi:DNA-binding CsgD family transcriptional regulator